MNSELEMFELMKQLCGTGSYAVLCFQLSRLALAVRIYRYVTDLFDLILFFISNNQYSSPSLLRKWGIGIYKWIKGNSPVVSSMLTLAQIINMSAGVIEVALKVIIWSKFMNNDQSQVL
jgi:hypothetical protein